jgi:hypothetical protein
MSNIDDFRDRVAQLNATLSHLGRIAGSPVGPKHGSAVALRREAQAHRQALVELAAQVSAEAAALLNARARDLAAAYERVRHAEQFLNCHGARGGILHSPRAEVARLEREIDALAESLLAELEAVAA